MQSTRPSNRPLSFSIPSTPRKKSVSFSVPLEEAGGPAGFAKEAGGPATTQDTDMGASLLTHGLEPSAPMVTQDGHQPAATRLVYVELLHFKADAPDAVLRLVAQIQVAAGDIYKIRPDR